MKLADGHVERTDVLTTVVDINAQGTVIPTEMLVIPQAKGNRTLLGTDFMRDAGIVLDIKRGKWYFS